MTRPLFASRSLLLTSLALLSFGCGSSKSSSGDGGGTGGSSATGGANGTGGATGTGGASGTGGAGGATGTGGAAGGATGCNPVAPTGVSVLQHHNDLARDGLYIDGAFPQCAVANMAIDTSFAGATVTGNVYAAPLYLAGSGSTPDEVIVATESDNVYAFNASTGAKVWPAKSVGTGVSSGLPCGNITPLGVTGTPVIDGTNRIIYLDAMTTDTTATAKHMVHAINADSGAEQPNWPVDLNAKATSGATTFQSTLQNQRAALTLLGGKVFIPFSGHVGDCDGYHGWMVGITTTGTPAVTAWATRKIAGGIWGSTGAASDGTSLFFATGNSKSSASAGPNTSSGTNNSDWTDWGDSETVYKFPTTLVSPATAATPVTTDFFAASNWVDLDKADADMGGTSPILVNVPGATPSALVVALGKDQNAYLLNRANLGGMDATPLAKTQVSNGNIISAAAAYTTSKGSYVVFRGSGSNCPGGTGGLVALKITAANPPTISTAWCGGPAGSGSPAVTQTDASGSNTIVWSVGSDNKLHGVDG
ncbi:MAG TPA: hypothetical protein VH853_24590, partial [Polyangia bacterium]|nr:hypothetical protein [Polyangia bacterium]